MDLKRLKDKTVPVTVEFMDEKLSVEFMPGAVTCSTNDLLANPPAENAMAHYAGLLAPMIADWNMTNGGKPFAPTIENLMELPARLLIAIMDAITTASRPDPTTSTDSDDI